MDELSELRESLRRVNDALVESSRIFNKRLCKVEEALGSGETPTCEELTPEEAGTLQDYWCPHDYKTVTFIRANRQARLYRVLCPDCGQPRATEEAAGETQTCAPEDWYTLSGDSWCRLHRRKTVHCLSPRATTEEPKTSGETQTCEELTPEEAGTLQDYWCPHGCKTASIPSFAPTPGPAEKHCPSCGAKVDETQVPTPTATMGSSRSTPSTPGGWEAT